MNIIAWASKWNIPYEAILELREELGVMSYPDESAEEKTGSESYVQSVVRLEASQKGLRLWRNNVGAVTTNDGRFIRFGLCNDSKKINERIKSADLIGIRPITISHAHVGCVIGQFVAREIKAENWKYSGTEREVAQLNFQKMITMFGGDAAFAKGEGSL